MIRQPKPTNVPTTNANQATEQSPTRSLTEEQFKELHATPLGDHIEKMLAACLDACLVGYNMSPVETALHLYSEGIADVEYQLPFELLIRYAFAYERALVRRARREKRQRRTIKHPVLPTQDSHNQRINTY